MDFITSILSGVLSGGATGLLGILLQRFFEWKKQQQDLEVIKLNHANAIELAKLESERAQVRAAADLQIADRGATATEFTAQQETAARDSEAANRSLVASYEHDRAAYLAQETQKRKGFVGALIAVMMAAVDFARGILRPGLTIHLTIIVTLMFSRMLQLLQDAGHQLTPDQVTPILNQIVVTILYCFTTCVVWWFGSRAPQPVK